MEQLGQEGFSVLFLSPFSGVVSLTLDRGKCSAVPSGLEKFC